LGVGDGGDVCVGRWWEIVAPLYVDIGKTMTMNIERKRHEKRKQRKSLHRLRQRRYHSPARDGNFSQGFHFDSFWILESGLEHHPWKREIMHNAKKKKLHWNKPG